MTTALATLPPLPKLPEAYNVIKALPEDQRIQLVETILAHYESGASIYDLAEKLGVHNGTIYRALKKYRAEDWKEIASARYEAEIEDAEKELKNADNPVAVTRARERIASARWKLERLDRKNYGQDQAAGPANAVQININLRGAQKEVELPTG